MAKRAALNVKAGEQKGRYLHLAGLETEARERRSTEASRSTQITINLPENPSEAKPGLVIFTAGLNKTPRSGKIA